jgi:hypothetical protein
MGIVYRARDERLERDIALKVLPPGTLADDGARKRFRKETLILSGPKLLTGLYAASGVCRGALRCANLKMSWRNR